MGSGLKGSSESTNVSESRPLNPDEVAEYFNRLNELTGDRLGEFAANGTAPTYYRSPTGQVLPPELDYSYQAPTYTGLLSTERGTVAPPRTFAGGVAPSTLSFAPPPSTANSLFHIDAPQIAYHRLAPEEIRSLGGAGATRQLEAGRARTEAARELAADPRLSLDQRQRAAQIVNRDYADSMDAIAREVESAIAMLASTEHGRALEADTTNAANALAAAQSNQETVKDIALAQMTQGSAMARLLQELESRGRITDAQLANDRYLRELSLDSAERQLTAELLNRDSRFAAENALDVGRFLSDLDRFNIQTAQENAWREYVADAANAGLEASDLRLLADIFFGGRGQFTTGTGTSESTGGLGDLFNIGIRL